MKDKQLRDHVYSIKSGQAWAALQKLKENGLDLKTPNDLVQHFIDNLDDLLEVANDSTINLDDYVQYTYKFEKWNDANQLLKDIHSICLGMYKDNEITKEQYQKFIEKFHGKSLSQMLNDYDEMKSSMLSSQLLEKVGYINVFKMNEEMRHA